MKGPRVFVICAAIVAMPATVFCTRVRVGYYPQMAVSGSTLYTQVAPGRLVAVDLDKRAVAWRFADTTVDQFGAPVFHEGGFLIQGWGPARSQILRVSAGKVLWRSAQAIGHFGSSFERCGDSVLVSSWSGRIQGLDVSSGRLRWERGIGTGLLPYQATVYGTSALYAVSHRGASPPDVVRLDCASGAVLESVPASGIAGTAYPLLVREHEVVFANLEPDGHTSITAFDPARRTIIWRSQLEAYPGPLGPGLLSGNSLMLTNWNKLVIIARDSGMVLFRKGLWFPPNAATIVGDRLIVQTGTAKLIAIDLGSFKTLWKASASGEILSNIVEAGDFLYVRTEANKLDCIRASDGRRLYSISLK